METMIVGSQSLLRGGRSGSVNLHRFGGRAVVELLIFKDLLYSPSGRVGRLSDRRGFCKVDFAHEPCPPWPDGNGERLRRSDPRNTLAPLSPF